MGNLHINKALHFRTFVKLPIHLSLYFGFCRLPMPKCTLREGYDRIFLGTT